MIYEKVDIRVKESMEGAYLQLYMLDASEELKYSTKRPVVLICPGGGYEFTSDREAEPVAMKYLAEGYHAAVLRYSVKPAIYPAALLETAAAVVYLRRHAKEYYIDENQIILQGFSAGGHLAASYATMWTEDFIAERMQAEKEELKPNLLILAYPVITSGEFAHHDSFHNLLGDRYEELKEKMSLEHQVNQDTPPVFIWHTYTDATVPAENSLLFMEDLRAKGIVTEFHLYPDGVHGLSLADIQTLGREETEYQEECQGWFASAVKFIRHTVGGLHEGSYSGR